MSESVVASLEGNTDIFSLIYDPKIRIVEDIGTDVVEVCLVKTGLSVRGFWCSMYR